MAAKIVKKERGTVAKSEVYVNKENLKRLTEIGEKKGVSTSAALSEILTNIGLNNKTFKPVVLQIPVELLEGNKDELKLWLETKSTAILNLFYQ